MDDIFRTLEKRKSCDILIALFENEELTGTELRQIAHVNSYVLQTRISELLYDGLITEKRERHLHNRRYISLTEKGKAVAKILIDLKETLILEHF